MIQVSNTEEKVLRSDYMNEIEYMPKPKDALGNTISLGDWVIYPPTQSGVEKYRCNKVQSMDYQLYGKNDNGTQRVNLWFKCGDCESAEASTCYLVSAEITQALKALEEGENTQNKMM